MEQRFYDMVEANPVIAAIKDMDGLEQCCRVPDIKVVFILYGDICNIADITASVEGILNCLRTRLKPCATVEA